MNYAEHNSVLFEEVLFQLNERLILSCAQSSTQNLVVMDGTFGAGGHSFAMLKSSPHIELHSFDQDPDAIENARQIQKSLNENELKRFNLHYSNFLHFDQFITKPLDFALLDLGVSSHHFDQSQRGFTFREDLPLDMRMDPNLEGSRPLSYYINQLPEDELADIIWKYGEERLSRKIASKIVYKRAQNQILSTKQLEEICFLAYPPNKRHLKTHPATKTFQAFRIWINKELEVVESIIPKLARHMAPGARFAVITFHSLEDRIVKHAMRDLVKAQPELFELYSRKPIYPSDRELRENKRARSAKLRVLLKKN